MKKTMKSTDRIPKKKRKQIKGFQVLENECIWMKAGVVNFRLCDNAYNCHNCPFDAGMRRAMNLSGGALRTKTSPEWSERLKRDYQAASRPCRHYLTGRIAAPKICSSNYECFHCAFDQMLDEVDLVAPPGRASCTSASGYKMAEGSYYHSGHSWARFEHGGRVRVGFDDFMVRLFGVLQAIDLPPLGARLDQNQASLVIERGEKKAAVLSPMTGVVLATNHKALEHPEIAHEDPYHEGWLLIMEPVDPKKNLKSLYFGRESFQWMEQEARRLLGLMGPKYEQLAATGGEPIGDVFGSFPKIGWNVLAQVFLGTKSL